ncbi:PREDICTED: protein BIG GRAIN 1-like E [Ipomoea nil]|uniref:protein BIG GRAIN 1-like E n=1 Tax=Ipomoea nil TaxID=35883 RepID=UPI0009013CF4|nr:PREDICTED: protein BIG GRAIN 1-like E [Ipomoea nil]
MSKILLHWRKDSGELEVFEAANYFSEDHHQISCLNNAFTLSHKLIRESCNNQAWRSGRMKSLDMSVAIRHSSTPFAAPQLKQGTSSSSLLPSSVQIMEKPAALKQKCKQPRTPGGGLASCLNTLFYLTVSSNKKKKKKNKKLISAMKDNEDNAAANNSPSGRMSSSINGSTLSNTAHNTTSSSSYPYNPRKSSCKDSQIPENEVEFTSESPERSVHHWADKYPSEENEHRKLDDGDDDGGEGDSDTSSDLFDLPNRELLDCYSTGLPVDGTTKCISSKN